MSFFETIKAEKGKLLNLEYHQKRLDRTRADFGFKDKLDLKNFIKEFPKEGIYRLRIEYKENFESLTCKEYQAREISTFKIVHSDISYEYKYSNREALDKLLVKEFDDIIIVKNGLLCDTSIANIAISVNGVWLTPQKPLLQGTTRQRLIDSGFLKSANLSIEDLKKSEKFAIMNALIGFKIINNVGWV